MERNFIGIFLFLFFFSSSAYAAPWAVVANFWNFTIHTIDLGTSPPTVYGPFLSGQLGTSGELVDVAIIPGTTYALISH